MEMIQKQDAAQHHFFSDLSVMLGRSLRHIFRSMDTIITATITPIGLMLLFVYVFGGAIQSGAGNYVNYVLPGIFLVAIASGTSYTSLRLFTDVQRGIMERFRSMPIASSTLLWGHVLASLVFNAISLLVIMLVALLMGFRSSAGLLPWLAVVAMLALVTLAFTWLAVIPGLTARSIDGAAAFAYPLIFLPFISSAFVPTRSMPPVVRAFAENQPMTAIVNTIRALLAGEPAPHEIWIALAWCVGMLLVASFLALRVYKKRVS
ncbi:ABC transporter permease [Thermogemmatispora carboxidivorans]|uniref:ABC transporter permease n=1 Tax=Thermogemmatispora carboxidivorans TaxID=1382306 RepID=UPI00069CB290|nr:ABC transporter permease [Thermogemmatispora carboxidivorans]